MNTNLVTKNRKEKKNANLENFIEKLYTKKVDTVGPTGWLTMG